MTATTRWQRARSDDLDEGGGLLLPDALTRACAAALSVAGAGLSYTLLPDRRVPLGASSPMAAAAERQQYTLGEGPCISAQRSLSTITASLEEMADRWPIYTKELTRLTNYRSLIALPVGGPLAGAAALDIYLLDSGQPPAALVEDTLVVAEHVGHELAEGLVADPDHTLGIPGAFRTPPALARHRVWLAIGHISARRTVPTSDALSLLRATAYTDGLDLETTANRILSHEISPPDPDPARS